MSSSGWVWGQRDRGKHCLHARRGEEPGEAAACGVSCWGRAGGGTAVREPGSERLFRTRRVCGLTETGTPQRAFPRSGMQVQIRDGTAWWGVSSPPTASGKSDPSPGPKGRRLLDRCWRAVRAAGSGRLPYGPPARSRLGSASLSARKGIHGAGCSSAARPGRPTGPLLGPPLGSLRWLPLAQGLPAGIGGGCGRALGPSLREAVGGLPVLTADLHSSAGRSLS